MSIKLWDVGDVKGQVGRAIIILNFDDCINLQHIDCYCIDGLIQISLNCDFYSFYDGPVDK